MDLGRSFQQAWRIAQLDRTAAREVAQDPQAMPASLVILGISGLVGSLLNPFFIPVAVVAAIVFAFIGIGIVHLVAKLFGGRGDFVPLFNAIAHGHGLVSFAGLIPFLGWLVSLVWGFVINVVVVEAVHGLPRDKAIIVVAIPFVLGLLCACVAMVTIGLGAFMAAGSFGNP